MEGSYEVCFGTKPVGKVQMIRQGLYYRFICRCDISGDVLCRLKVVCGEKEENLGVLVPMEDGFGLDKKLAAKRLGEGPVRFFITTGGGGVLPAESKPAGQFVPIYPDEPFAYIARVKDAFFVRQNGQAGLMIK